jgi:hypothetical protein
VDPQEESESIDWFCVVAGVKLQRKPEAERTEQGLSDLEG